MSLKLINNKFSENPCKTKKTGSRTKNMGIEKNLLS
jgi:hypothetical protein